MANRDRSALGKPGDCASRLPVLADEMLNESIGVRQNLLSHHLRVLRDAGPIEAERDGRAVLNRLSPDARTRARGREINLGCCHLSFD